MEYYKEAQSIHSELITDNFGYVVREYDKKYDKNENLIETRIYEYKNGKFGRESVIPVDKTKPTTVSRQIGSDFEKCSYINGNLTEYVHGNYDKGKKEIEEIYRFRSDGSLESYYRNIKVDPDDGAIAKEKLEFDANGKLINTQNNVRL